jgi:hypothetical protein
LDRPLNSSKKAISRGNGQSIDDGPIDKELLIDEELLIDKGPIDEKPILMRADIDGGR